VKSMPSMKAVLDIEQIKGVLPHRCGACACMGGPYRSGSWL
jgi:hypothetical protein